MDVTKYFICKDVSRRAVAIIKKKVGGFFKALKKDQSPDVILKHTLPSLFSTSLSS